MRLSRNPEWEGTGEIQWCELHHHDCCKTANRHTGATQHGPDGSQPPECIHSHPVRKQCIRHELKTKLEQEHPYEDFADGYHTELVPAWRPSSVQQGGEKDQMQVSADIPGGWIRWEIIEKDIDACEQRKIVRFQWIAGRDSAQEAH